MVVPPVAARVVTYIQTTKTFDRILKKLNIIEIGETTFVGKIKIEEEHCNSKGTTHGGFLAMYMDVGAILSTYSKKWNYTPGFTVSFDAKFVAKSKINDELIVEARAMKFTDELAFVNILLKKNEDESIVAIGSALLKSAQRTNKDLL